MFVIFSANNSNLPSGLQVVIEDRTLGVFEILDVTNTYTVQLASSENGIGRFYLHTRFESVWDGNTDSVWATATNWNNDLNPLETSNIRIPNVANSPTVSGEITKSNNLVIEASAALDVSSDGGVIVAGNFDNSGEVSITSTNVSSGTFIVKGTSNGTVSFERTGLQASKWSLITAPVTGQTVKEFIENPANDIRVNPTVTPNRYAVAYYDDSQPAGSKWVYYTADDIITNAITFEKGKSYIVSRGSNGSVTFSGSLTTSDETIAVVADQWNAVGNPYTAYLPINNNANLNFLQDNLSKFDPVNVGVYVWDNGQNKYVAKTLIDAELSLTVGQGFFVKTGTGVSSITFKESQRLSDNTGVQTFSKGNTTPSIKLIAIQDGVEVETKINFSENSTKELDPGYDIGNFKGASFDIFTHLAENSEGKDFTIQSLSNEDVEGLIIPVGITSEANKNISIKVKKEELPQGLNIYLEDKLTGEFVALDNANEYSIKMDNKMDGIGRFYLHTSSKTLDVNDVIIDVSDIKIFKSNTQEITISGVDSNTTTKVQVFSVLGSEVLNEEFKGNNKIVVRTNNVQTGVYIVRIDMNGTVKSKKVVLD